MSPVLHDRGAAWRGAFWPVAVLILLGGIAPLVIYWMVFGRGAMVTPSQARQWLDAQDPPAVLVDVRSAEEFRAGHVHGAVHWPREEILTLKSSEEVPSALRDKTLLVICSVGLASHRAAGHLAARGVPGVYNVRGGLQEWSRSDAAVGCWLASCGQSPEVSPPIGREVRAASDGRPFRSSTPLEQLVAVASFFWIKPTYTVISLVLVLVLWQSRAPDLAALRWGMIFFFLGENACAANYFLFRENSYLAEYLHSLGMLVCFAFIIYATLEGFDRRVLMLSDPHRRCAALALCRACVKHGPVPCGLRRTFYLIIPGLMLVALMLPLADWQDTSYNTLILGQPYHYAHLRIYQFFENWYCAAVALLMLGMSLAILILTPGQAALGRAKIAFAAGAGPLGFGMLRMLLGSAYDQNRVWYLFWEEFTELLLIASICGVLWIFRRSLLAWVPTKRESPGNPPMPIEPGPGTDRRLVAEGR